ncbi:MAG: hypothetical protein HXX09_08215 [Bacteroidetes bacterium]|nr:hypothetical protein [Bacteroidota bacterium]
MKTFKISIFAFLFGFLFFPFASFSQDTILLLNGEKYAVKIIKISNDSLTFVSPGKDGGKERQIEKIDVFSLISANGNEIVTYRQDTNAGNNFSVEQMRNYIYGEQDARRNYHAPMMTVMGVISGVGGFVGLGFYGLMVPPLTTALFSIKSPRIKTKCVSKPELIKNDYYMTGYQSVAIRKKVKNGLIGGIVSFAVSAVAITIYNNNK